MIIEVRKVPPEVIFFCVVCIMAIFRSDSQVRIYAKFIYVPFITMIFKKKVIFKQSTSHINDFNYDFNSILSEYTDCLVRYIYITI